MHANRTPSGRVAVLADRDVTTLGANELDRLIDAISDSHVLVVAPAGPVAGERWIVDMSARRAQAEQRLAGWATLLVQHAHELELEVGDQNPHRALSDACGGFRPDEVIASAPLAERSACSSSVLSRLPAVSSLSGLRLRSLATRG